MCYMVKVIAEYVPMIEGSRLEVKLPTICRDGKAGGKSQRGEVKK